MSQQVDIYSPSRSSRSSSSGSGNSSSTAAGCFVSVLALAAGFTSSDLAGTSSFFAASDVLAAGSMFVIKPPLRAPCSTLKAITWKFGTKPTTYGGGLSERFSGRGVNQRVVVQRYCLVQRTAVEGDTQGEVDVRAKKFKVRRPISWSEVQLPTLAGPRNRCSRPWDPTSPRGEQLTGCVANRPTLYRLSASIYHASHSAAAHFRGG